MEQVARNLTDADNGALLGQRYLLHDRDTKFCAGFRSILRDGGVEPLRLPPSSPDLNAFAERWVRSAKQECLSKLILFGENSLRRALTEYVAHFHSERNHQGLGNRLIRPDPAHVGTAGAVQCRERLGGMLNYYYRAAA
jgi:transposase InsO family protein